MNYRIVRKDAINVTVITLMPYGAMDTIKVKELLQLNHVLDLKHARHSSRGFFWKTRDLEAGDEFHIPDH